MTGFVYVKQAESIVKIGGQDKGLFRNHHLGHVEAFGFLPAKFVPVMNDI